MEEVGRQFDLTRERIRQIEAKALRKLRHPGQSAKVRTCLDGILAEVPVRQLPLDVFGNLYPSRYCPSDRLVPFAIKEFGGLRQGYERVRAIQGWVRTHVRPMAWSAWAPAGTLLTCRSP